MKIGMDNADDVSPRGISGRLTVWWTTKTKVQILFSSQNFFNCDVTINQYDETTYITCVYADTEAQKRSQNWDTLRSTGRGRRGRWIVLGDFTTISHPHEREGNKRKPQTQINEFKKLIEDLRMEDIGVKRQPFTWCNN